MRQSRFVILFGFVSIGLIVVAQPEWLAACGCDPFGTHQARTALRGEAEREQRLATLDGNIRRRMEIKESLVDGLIAGRRTLAEVTAEFINLHRDHSEDVSTIQSRYPGGSDAERTARNVIGYVERQLQNEPSARQTEVLARLEVELRSLGEVQVGAP